MTVPYKFPEWGEDFEKLCSSPDWIKYTIENIDENGTIGDFKYSSEGAHLLSSIITKATKKSAREFANEYLFKDINVFAENKYGYLWWTNHYDDLYCNSAT